MSNIYTGLKGCDSFDKTVQYLQRALLGIVKRPASLKTMPRKAAMALAAFLFWGIAPTVAADAPPAMIVPGQMNVTAAGAFNYSIPIIVPPGTAGIAPKLSLDYSSTGGNSIMGFGWSLGGLPSVSRCPRTVAQDGVHGSVNYDNNDRFCLDGQRLVVISGTYGANGAEYRTEIESFAKVISYGTAGNGPAYFKVWTKSGQIIEFGNTTDSRILAQGKSTARAWAANKISDVKGNYFTITYTNDTTNGQFYPTRIDYTGNTAAGLSPYNSVRFSYINRTDVTPAYHAGSLMQMTVLLSDIKTYSAAAVVTDYKLAYQLGNSPYDQLTSVSRCDGSNNCLAPLTFGWQVLPGQLNRIVVASTQPVPGTTPATYLPYDFNGDGLTDASGGTIFTSNCFGPVPYGEAPLYNSFDNGTTLPNMTTHLADGSSMPACIWGPSIGTPPTALGDFNGDGLTDMTVPDGWMGVLVTLNNGAGQFNQVGGFLPQRAQGNLFADFNGDGRTDYFVTDGINNGMWGGHSYAYLSDGTGTFSPDGGHSAGTQANPAFAQLLADFDGDGCTDILLQGGANKALLFCNPAVTSITTSNWNTGSLTGDFNGDGNADFIAIPYSGAATVNISTGTSFIASTSSTISGMSGPALIYPGDFDGDGKTDLLVQEMTDYKIFTWTSSGFALALTVNQELPRPNYQGSDPNYSGTLRIGDINGDGCADLIVYNGSPATEWFTSFGCHPPLLMTSISNGVGASTTVNYYGLNRNGTFYSKGSGAVYPTRDIDGPLYVVKEIDTSNGIGGNYSQTYSYAGAKADLSGRGFLGFSQITLTDSQTNTIQTTSYRTDYPYAGTIASQTKTHLGTTLQQITNTYGATSLGGTRYFVSLTQSVMATDDLDGTALPAVTASYTYDAYGNALTATTSVSDGSSKITTSTYSNDTTNWFLGRLLTTQTQSIVGSSNLIRHASYTYDSTTGLLTSEIVEPGASDPTLTMETDYTYDAYGNRIRADVKGCVWTAPGTCTATTRTTLYTYDVPTYHASFETSATNALSQSEGWTYSSAFGVSTGHTDLNNLTQSWSYDSLGRVTLDTRPDGNKVATSYAYCSGVNGGSATCPSFGAFTQTATPKNSLSAQNGPTSIAYYDVLGRVIATDLQGFNGSWIRTETRYDALGHVAQTSRPYFLSGGTPAWTTNSYDDLGRITRTTAPDTSYANYVYHGLTTSATAHVLRPGLSAQDQVTTTVKNAQGLNASVTDPNNKTTSYVYDAFGNLKTVTDPASNVTTNIYDLRGRKTDSTDPDMGHWTYVYDSYGELYKQTDAKSQMATLTYDALGRVLTRTESGLTSTWTYDTATKGIGKEAAATTGSNYLRTDTYDSLGRPSTVTLRVDGTDHVYTTTYNSDGRVDTLTYPSGLVAKYLYTGLGYVSQIKDNAAGTVWWQANTRDAELRLTQSMAANGVATTQVFDTNTGLVQQIRAGVADSVFNSSYTFDSVGNLYSRADTIQGYTENFCYDILNRLVNSALGASCTASGYKVIAYNDISNITSKSDACTAGACTYSYGASAGPHALTSITGTVNGVVNPTYVYDLNGNLTSGDGRTITYTAFNMSASIAQGTTLDCFTYDSEHSRVKMEGRTSTCSGTLNNTTYYLNAMGAMSEKFVAGATTTWRDYIMADGHMVAERFKVVGGSTSLRYFVLDHLGSIAAITDEAGTVVERMSYDAWGKRRNANGTDAVCGTITSQTTRGFTGHEELDNICLINMNARVYDPVVGRFTSADTLITDMLNLQDWNAYTYVNNNPLSFTDPTGHSGGDGEPPRPEQIWVTASMIPVFINITVQMHFSGFSDAAAFWNTTLTKFGATDIGITQNQNGNLAFKFTCSAGNRVCAALGHELNERFGGSVTELASKGESTDAYDYASGETGDANGASDTKGDMQVAQAAMALCAIGPEGCVAGAGITAAQAVLDGVAAGGAVILMSKIPKDAKDPKGAKAPGKPGAAEGFKDPKGGERWVKNPNGRGSGWLDDKGRVWVPSGKGGSAHGGPQWDVQTPGGGYDNVYPGGKVRPGG